MLLKFLTVSTGKQHDMEAVMLDAQEVSFEEAASQLD